MSWSAILIVPLRTQGHPNFFRYVHKNPNLFRCVHLYEAEQIRIFKKLILPLCTNLYETEELVLWGIHHIPEVTQNTNTKANIIYGERRQQPKPL